MPKGLFLYILDNTSYFLGAFDNSHLNGYTFLLTSMYFQNFLPGTCVMFIIRKISHVVFKTVLGIGNIVNNILITVCGVRWVLDLWGDHFVSYKDV